MNLARIASATQRFLQGSTDQLKQLLHISMGPLDDVEFLRYGTIGE
jgi:hypothetical protein